MTNHPMLSFRLGQTRWQDRVNPKGDPYQSAQLLSDPARAAAMSDVSRAEARRQFHPDVIADAHVAIYREVLGTA